MRAICVGQRGFRFSGNPSLSLFFVNIMNMDQN